MELDIDNINEPEIVEIIIAMVTNNEADRKNYASIYELINRDNNGETIYGRAKVGVKRGLVGHTGYYDIRVVIKKDNILIQNGDGTPCRITTYGMNYLLSNHSTKTEP